MHRANGCFRKVDQRGARIPRRQRRMGRRRSRSTSTWCPPCAPTATSCSSRRARTSTRSRRRRERGRELGATEISNSFVGAETPEDASSYDHPGIPTAAAGGDSGYAAESPASYPGVIAVGGTSLHPAGRAPWLERERLGPGVGRRNGQRLQHEPKPAWQTDAGCLNRTTNDVSAVADPNTPVSVYDSYPPMTWLDADRRHERLDADRERRDGALRASTRDPSKVRELCTWMLLQEAASTTSPPASTEPAAATCAKPLRATTGRAGLAACGAPRKCRRRPP